MDKHAAERILGLAGSYDAQELKAAFRRLAAEHHPDAAGARGGDKGAATARMQEINEAHDLLSAQFGEGVVSVSCDEGPSRAASGRNAAGGAPRNPFDAPSSRARPARRRETTAEYYYRDPRFQAHLDERRRRAERARREGASGEARWGPEPVADGPDRPNPRWYGPVRRFLAAFPYRFALLFGMCLLAGLTDPLGAGRTTGPFSFEEFLLFIGLLNLVVPVITDPIRYALLWIVDRLCRAARGRGGRTP